MQDNVLSGRAAKVLTIDAVKAIRANQGKATYGELAKIHGVSQTTIRNVLLRLDWRHVD
jgi:uncharacterized membrane protein